MRAVLVGYIGGGWGADRQDALHQTEAFVIRGTDFEGVTRGDTTGVPFRYHKPTNAKSRCLEEGDIVFEVSGGSKDQPVGRSLLITAERLRRFPAPVIPASFCKRISPDRAHVDPRFLHAHLQAAWLDRRIVQWQVQSTGISNFKFEAFLDQFELWLPPLPVQQQIAGVLSTYDELIENSQRRITILEAMARALYREWFIDFRFPGHENHPRVASPLGAIPRGWEVTTLRSVTTKIGSGATPRGGKDSYKPEGIHLIRSLNVYDYDFVFDDLAFIDEQQAAELDNVRVEDEDILLNITGASVARCALVLSSLLPARVNQHVAIVRTDQAKASPYYVLDAINSDQRKQQLLALAQGGATREALTKDTVSNFEIILPPPPLMAAYDAIARVIHKQREVLLRQTHNLRRTRDLLLPRLLQGQIDVEALAS